MIYIHLDALMAQRKMKLNELAKLVDITVANLSILKSGRAKAIRFTTLSALCQALDCQPGDLISYKPNPIQAPVPRITLL